MFMRKMYVRHIRTGAIGRVTEVNNLYGYIIVKFIAPYELTKRYSSLDEKQLGKSLCKMTVVEIADFRLEQEQRGITDSWQE